MDDSLITTSTILQLVMCGGVVSSQLERLQQHIQDSQRPSVYTGEAARWGDLRRRLYSSTTGCSDEIAS